MKTGEYYLEGAREVGSGFLFKPDFTFEFFYSYGAIDRIAQGHWKQNGNSLILNNVPKPDKDFIFITSRQTREKKLVIQINDPNEMILRHIYCQVRTTGEEVLEGRSNEEGTIVLDAVEIRDIALIHALWPDRYSFFEVSNPRDDYFEFMIGPWIADVEFTDLTLYIGDNTLLGPHPLMEGKEWKYVMSE